MKRIFVGERSPSKRPRLEDNLTLFDETRRKNATDLFDPATDGTNNIEVKVHMIFPCINTTRQVNVEMHEHGDTYRLIVLISSKVDELLPFPFTVNDRICLSLKGAQIRPRAPSSAPYYLPVALVFKDGIAAMLMSGPSAGKVFSTWEVDLYHNATVGIPHIRDITNQSPRPRIGASQKTGEEPTPVLVPQQHLISSVANLPQSDARSPKKELTKQQRRRQKRQARKSAALETSLESGGHEMTAPQAVVASRVPLPALTDVRSAPQEPFNEHTSCGSEQTSSSSSNRATPMSSASSANDPARNHGSLTMKAGIATKGGDEYIPIRKIEPGLGLFNVIGVVTSTKPLAQTYSQEWSRNFTIVDPSCMEDDVDVVIYNFKVNCFQKKRIEWLPQAEVGDIVLFRDLKISEWAAGFNGVGYHDKLRWATYDTQTRRFRDPDRKDAPHSEKSPYYKPYMQCTEEAEYCGQLADWWQGLQAKQQGITTVQCAPRPSREHHLISEVTPNTSPRGYFDCTVEILYTYENISGPHTVYVTDYTVNHRTNPPQASWCSPELSAYVFKMDMWDDAGILAKTMQPGEFWYLPNARVMTDSYVHLYGKLVETNKSKKLDEVANGGNLHFRALLERKKKFEREGGASGSSARFDTKLIEDVDGEVAFFHCTVEVLHVDLASVEEPVVYVTDYTFNPDLVDSVHPAPWGLGLNRRIVKIVLGDGQKERARDLQAGAMYRIKNLRLIRKTGVKGAFGRLGGDERLIIATSDREKEAVKALLQRKEKWKLTMYNWQRQVRA
ncbi:uncharacterized protein BJ212DRAFT_59345 [Suillus subaureus]|uniref:Telomeric single stranded DNA binding POT1/Cdc13 domain-containing protein n=1 Tax=Suillus subaureus TaxID=48587 RepID=A0A9P7JK85_9AGAM|nr:uncharacterized protein BJ212DRAFT_59345 [Suillus subaureus]KAG1827544.1 hypothetical protein BJ212DRAFT_59345 [Suillus subaureus]